MSIIIEKLAQMCKQALSTARISSAFDSRSKAISGIMKLNRPKEGEQLLHRTFGQGRRIQEHARRMATKDSAKVFGRKADIGDATQRDLAFIAKKRKTNLGDIRYSDHDVWEIGNKRKQIHDGLLYRHGDKIAPGWTTGQK